MIKNEIVERRQDPNNVAIVVLMESLTDQVKALRHEVAELKRNSNFSAAITEEMIEKAVNKAMNSAFPDGDPEGHRAMHEAEIKRVDARTNFYRTLQTEVAKWGLLALLGFAAVALWKAFLQGVVK